MARIVVASVHDLRFMLRQTPCGDGRWGDVKVSFDPADPHDWLVVFDTPPKGSTTRVPRERRIAVLEPPDVRTYPPAFLNQFGMVIGPVAPRGFSGVVTGGQPCLPWFYGARIGNRGDSAVMRDWDELLQGPSMPTVRRPGLISAVCSTKTITMTQMRRLRFVRMLKARLGGSFSLFGRGFAPLDDKAEGLDGFRYHVVLENNLIPGFWTEKLADAILAGAFPIVAGGGGLARWLDPAGFAEIDIRAPRAAVEQVLALLARDPVADPRTQMALVENRRRLMQEHQLFPVLKRLTTDAARAGVPQLAEPVRLSPPASARMARLTKPLRPLRKLFMRGWITLRETD